MKLTLAIAVALLSFTLATSAQDFTKDVIQNRINSLHAQKSISITSDADAKTTKIMAVSENVSRDEANRSGIMAMNFAIGLFYPGQELKSTPETFLLTFWVLTKKPRFAGGHDMTVVLPDEMLVIGSGRYVSKPRDEMEYLNFEVSRENLMKIASQTETRFKLGDHDFTFTRSQMKLFADLLTVTNCEL